MIVPSLLLYFVLLFWENYAILQIKDSLKKKNLRFVDNLRHDLRRNNDDYAAIARLNNATQVFDNKRTGEQELSKSGRRNENVDVRDKLIDKIRRRVNDALLSKESKFIDSSENNLQRRAAITANQSAVSKNLLITSTKVVPFMKPFWKNQNNIKPEGIKAIPEQVKSFSNKSKEFSHASISINDLRTIPFQSTTTMMKVEAVKDKPKQIKEKKMEKFKKFIDKNKGLLKEFISSKMAVHTPMILTTRKPNLRLRVSKKMSKSKSELHKALQEAMNGVHSKRLEDLPNAELLDMAPAKGGRIYHKRLRGRLCHRHVLIPEGPKYGGGGGAYLAAHAARRGRDYNATAAPPLLLPRCCNCCRKSLLGCQ